MRRRKRGVILTHTSRDGLTGRTVTTAISGDGTVTVSGSASGRLKLPTEDVIDLVDRLDALGIDHLSKRPPQSAPGFEASTVTIEIPRRVGSRSFSVVGLRNTPGAFPPALVEIDRVLEDLARRALR